MEDEEDFTVDNITTGAGGNPFAVRSDFDLKAQVEQDRADLKAAYDRARGVLAERYRGPSQRELLLSLGQAFLTPTEGGSFREALPNVVATLAGYEGKRREAKSSLAEKKAELDIAEIEARRKAAKDLYTLEAQYQRATTPKTGFNPVTGQLEYTTGPSAGMPVRGGQQGRPGPQQRVVVIDGVTYPVNLKGELGTPVPARDQWISETVNGVAGQRNTATGEFKPYPASVQKPTADLSAAESTAQTLRSLITTAKSHPGLPDVVGVPGITGGLLGTTEAGEPRIVPGTNAAGFYALHKQLKGKAFLSAYNMLRGGGAITQVEGDKAGAAMARLDLAQTEEEYKAALDDFLAAYEEGVAKMRAARGSGVTPGTPSVTILRRRKVGE